MRTSCSWIGILLGGLGGLVGCVESEMVRSDPDLPIPNKPHGDFMYSGYDFGGIDTVITVPIGTGIALRPPLIRGNIDWDDLVVQPGLQRPRGILDSGGDIEIGDFDVLQPTQVRPRIALGDIELTGFEVFEALDICRLLPSTGICADLCDPLAFASQWPDNVCMTIACELANGDTLITGGCN